MKPLIQKVIDNWEKASFWAMLLLWLALGGWWIAGRLGGGEGSTVPPRRGPAHKPLINIATALAFREPPPAVKFQGHPFSFVLQQPKKTVKPWGTKPKFTIRRPAPPKVTKVTKPGKRPPKPAPPKPKPPKPKVRKVVRIIEYRGCMTTPSGKKLALVYEQTTKKIDYLLPNQKIGGLQVKEFTPKKLVVVGPDGKVRDILFGQTHKVEFTVPNG